MSMPQDVDTFLFHSTEEGGELLAELRKQANVYIGWVSVYTHLL